MDWITLSMAAVAAVVLCAPIAMPRISLNRSPESYDVLEDLRVVRRVGEAMAAKGSVEGVKAANALIEAALSIPMPAQGKVPS